jgi:hypothetical protein
MRTTCTSPPLPARAPRRSRRAALAALACLPLLHADAEDGGSDAGGGGTTIPALGADALGTLWPTIAPHLPHAVAGMSASVEGAGRDDRVATASAWAGWLAHPSASLSWGVGGMVGSDDVDEGPGIPRAWHSARLIGGIWRRFGLDDHLLVIAAPGASWSTPGAGVAWTLPVAGLWIHRANDRLAWGVGAAALIWDGQPIALPIAGAQLCDGPWTTLATPLMVASDRLLNAHASMGAAIELAGDSAPLVVAGARAAAALWQARAVLRGRWSAGGGLALAGEAGWEPERHLLVIARGHPAQDRRLHSGAVASASALWTW